MASAWTDSIGDILMEDVSLSDIKPARRKISDEPHRNETPDDRTFLANDPVRGPAQLTLKMLRSIRRIHSKSRIDYAKRLKVIGKLYKKTGMEGEGGGLPM